MKLKGFSSKLFLFILVFTPWISQSEELNNNPTSEKVSTNVVEVTDPPEETKVVSVNFSTGFYSDYVYRGFNLYDGTSIQPSLSTTFALGERGSIGASIWSHLSTETDDKTNNFSEVDYTLSYSYTMDLITASIGNSWYTYPHDNSNSNLSTKEYFLSLTASTFLNPTLSFYKDYDSFDADYYEVSFSQVIDVPKLGEGFALTPYTSVGFGAHSRKVYNDNGLVQITVGTSLTLPLGNVNFVPSLNYTHGIDESTTDTFWLGTKISYDF